MKAEKGPRFCRGKSFCHLDRTKQPKFGRTVESNQMFGRSLVVVGKKKRPETVIFLFEKFVSIKKGE